MFFDAKPVYFYSRHQLYNKSEKKKLQLKKVLFYFIVLPVCVLTYRSMRRYDSTVMVLRVELELILLEYKSKC